MKYQIRLMLVEIDDDGNETIILNNVIGDDEFFYEELPTAMRDYDRTLE